MDSALEKKEPISKEPSGPAVAVVERPAAVPVIEQTAREALTEGAVENLRQMEHPVTTADVTSPQDQSPVSAGHLEAIGTTADVATNYLTHKVGTVLGGNAEERAVSGGESETGSSTFLGRLWRKARGKGGEIQPRKDNK